MSGWKELRHIFQPPHDKKQKKREKNLSRAWSLIDSSLRSVRVFAMVSLLPLSTNRDQVLFTSLCSLVLSGDLPCISIGYECNQRMHSQERVLACPDCLHEKWINKDKRQRFCQNGRSVAERLWSAQASLS